MAGRAEQLGADEHGEQPAGEEEQQHADGVLVAHHLVVVRHAEVAHPTLLGRHRDRLVPQDFGQRIGEPADAGHPTDHSEHQAEHDGHVVLPGVLDLGVPACDDVAEPVADQVADDGARHGPQHVRAQPGRAAPWRHQGGLFADVLLARVLELVDLGGVNRHTGAPSSRQVGVVLVRGDARSCQPAPWACGAPYCSIFE